MVRKSGITSAETDKQSQSESRMIEKIKAGDNEAIKELYQKNFHRIKAYIMKKGGNEADARDIFQDGMLALMLNIRNRRFENETLNLSAWLFRVCANRWHEWMKSAAFRKQTGGETLKEQADDIDLLSGIIEAEQARYLYRLFGKLGDRCRDLLDRFYFRRERLAEIAAELNISPASAKNEKYRCMKKLKELHQS